MQPTGSWPPAPPAAPVRPRDEPLPPAPVVLAGICAIVGVLPSLLVSGPVVFLVLGLFARVPGAEVLLFSGVGRAVQLVVAVLAALSLPVLQGWGAVRLFTGRGRALLFYGCVPVTVLVAFGGAAAVLSGEPGDAAILLLLAGPAVAPLFALAPSARSWPAERPVRVG